MRSDQTIPKAPLAVKCSESWPGAGGKRVRNKIQKHFQPRPGARAAAGHRPPAAPGGSLVAGPLRRPGQSILQTQPTRRECGPGEVCAGSPRLVFHGGPEGTFPNARGEASQANRPRGCRWWAAGGPVIYVTVSCKPGPVSIPSRVGVLRDGSGTRVKIIPPTWRWGNGRAGRAVLAPGRVRRGGSPGPGSASSCPPAVNPLRRVDMEGSVFSSHVTGTCGQPSVSSKGGSTFVAKVLGNSRDQE